MPGKNRLIDRRGKFPGLLRIMPARGPRSVLCVVEVTMCACGTGRWMRSTGDQSGEVRHIHKKERANFVRNLTHAGKSMIRG